MNVHVRPQLVFVDKAFLADVADEGFLRVRSVMLELVVLHLGAAHDELAAVGTGVRVVSRLTVVVQKVFVSESTRALRTCECLVGVALFPVVPVPTLSDFRTTLLTCYHLVARLDSGPLAKMGNLIWTRISIQSIPLSITQDQTFPCYLTQSHSLVDI